MSNAPRRASLAKKSKGRNGSSLPSFASRTLAPVIEQMEDRRLMTAAGFLSGSVLTDGASGAPLPGVTVELFKVGTTAPLATTATDANGQYLFTALQPGDYLLKDVAPSGYATSGAVASSQLFPASAVGSDTIKVTVVDPAKVYVNYGGVVDGSYVSLSDSVKGTPRLNATGPFHDTLGTTAGATDLNSGYQTFCVNNEQDLSFAGGESYRVTPKPISALTDGTSVISADHSGRIGYLFNHFGNASLSNVEGAGLQLAIWELLYDSGDSPDFAAGAFQVTAPYGVTDQATLDAAVAQAATYYNASAGHSESAVFLDAAAANPGQTQGLQSVLATGSLNFTLHTTQTPPCCCDLTNVHYVINGCKSVTTLGGNVKAGDTVEVDFTVPAGETDTVSLVSYTTCAKPGDADFLTSQKVFCYDTKTFGSGDHSLKVTVPCTNFQVDFVCGNVICHFDPSHGVTYHAQNRFMDGAVGTATQPKGGDCGGNDHGGWVGVCNTDQNKDCGDKGHTVCDTNHDKDCGDKGHTVCDTNHDKDCGDKGHTVCDTDHGKGDCGDKGHTVCDTNHDKDCGDKGHSVCDTGHGKDDCGDKGHSVCDTGHGKGDCGDKGHSVCDTDHGKGGKDGGWGSVCSTSGGKDGGGHKDSGGKSSCG